ncbi:MAG: hypothetical protein LAT50_10640 [Ectothiorhodospiraceae bacterium]|nr:hypothetical protein [Ectothiorhodospiraceae bacterium]
MHKGIKSAMQATLAAAILLLPAAHADRLLIDAVQETESASMDRPRNGQTMDQVERRFGAPNDRVAAVGEPPISRWIYGEYTVYFEHDRVLRAVERRD